MMEKNKKGILFFSLILFHFYIQAQEFAWKSMLNNVPKDGFYCIPLSLDWMVHVKPDLSDIRIKDGQNQIIPFLIKQHSYAKGSSFIEFPILKNVTDSATTILELDARGRQGIDHISLVIGNTTVERMATLSGSNDRSQWFIIDENLLLTNGVGNDNDRFIQSLYFPFIRYPYLRLMINNRGTDPLPILRAGVYADTIVKESVELYLHSGTSYRQKDSIDGNTYVWVHNQMPYSIDQISMILSGPKFYKRSVQIYNVVDRKRKDLLTATEFRSGEDPVLRLQAVKAQDLLVVIQNNDNPPLKVVSVNTQGRKHQLIAYLEKGKEYALLGGSTTASSPQYDLAHFRDSIPAQPAILEPGPILPNDRVEEASTKNKYQWIWPSIIIMLLMLGLLTYKLVGDMKKVEV